MTCGFAVREPRKAGPLKDRGGTVRHADADEPATLVRAFKGADTVLINGTNYDIDPARRAQQHAAAITAAAESGAGRLVITWQDLDHCPMPEVSDYPATETRARAARIPVTIMRLTSDLAALVARDVRWAVAAGTLMAPAGQARITPAAVTDLAEATANVLREAGHEDATYELTGPDPLGWDEHDRGHPPGSRGLAPAHQHHETPRADRMARARFSQSHGIW